MSEDYTRDLVEPPQVLWKGWTMPPYAGLASDYSEPGRRRARRWALLGIVFLSFALKGSPNLVSAVSAIVNVILALFIDKFFQYQYAASPHGDIFPEPSGSFDRLKALFSERLKALLPQEPELISTFGLFLAILLSMIILPVFIDDWQLYKQLDLWLKNNSFAGSTSLTPLIFSAPLAFFLWYFKARIVDGNKIHFSTIGWAILVTFVVAVFVGIIAWLPDGIFAPLLKIVAGKTA